MGGHDGTNRLNDVWSSTDGSEWCLATESAEWVPRYRHAAAEFDGRMWVLGGDSYSGKLNDVWYSQDGIQWTEAEVTGLWSPRILHAATGFRDRLWVAGGYDTGFAHDVWYSFGSVSCSERNRALPEPGPRLFARPTVATRRVLLTLRLRVPSAVRLAAYDVHGAPARHIYSGKCQAGASSFYWDGTTDDGQLAPAGFYVIRLESSAGPDEVLVQLVR
jgi:hypothetical protein